MRLRNRAFVGRTAFGMTDVIGEAVSAHTSTQTAIPVRSKQKASQELNRLHDSTTAGQTAHAAAVDTICRRMAAALGPRRLAPADGRSYAGTSQRQRRVRRLARPGLCVADHPPGT